MDDDDIARVKPEVGLHLPYIHRERIEALPIDAIADDAASVAIQQA